MDRSTNTKKIPKPITPTGKKTTCYRNKVLAQMNPKQQKHVNCHISCKLFGNKTMCPVDDRPFPPLSMNKTIWGVRGLGRGEGDEHALKMLGP